MSTDTLSPTLFYDLTSPKAGVTRMEYPATDLIYKLLHHTGADVSSFRRNCQVSYRLVEYARDLYDEINSRIYKAEESGNWEHYDAYNRAIDPLEEVLLSIMAVTADERNEHLLHATTPDLAAGLAESLIEQSVETWIKRSISDWIDNRQKIRDFLDSFKIQEEFKGFLTTPLDYDTEIQSAKAHDDRTLLQNLLKSIGENESQVEKSKSQSSKMVKKVKDSLQSSLDFLKGSPKKSLEDELSVLAIKCAMITYGVTELMKDDKVKHLALYDRLYGSTIWDTAQTLATSIHDHLKRNDEAPNLSKLHTIYTELENALTGEVSVLMPEDYHRLFPLVGKIGRAYHAQSLVLASLCHQVASHFEKEKRRETREDLEKALAKTIDAFMAAEGLNNKPGTNGTDHAANGTSTNGVASNGVRHSMTDEYDQSCERLYDESLDEIESCYAKMNMNKGSNLKEKLEAARTRDQERLKLYRTRVTKGITAREFVDLTLMVFNDGGSSSMHKLHVKVLPTARLSYIKWMTAREIKDVEILRFEDTEKQPLPLDAEIKPLVKGNKCTLHVIVQKGEPKTNGSQ
ncbi:hypothetical protein B0J17DRAFT_354073 [Rhizoctonia solani]|nr:hypothetical protein B0J17DRAFT_354073 [Rhizoctonia solani]